MEIEDIVDDFSVRPTKETGKVVARYRKKQNNNFDEMMKDYQSDCVIPELTRIYIQTWGCSHNTSDSEYMAGILQAYGFRVELAGATNFHEKDDCDEADCCGDSSKTPDQNVEASLFIFNSCTVKGPAEDHFRNAVERARQKGIKVIVAGCVPQGQRSVKYLKNISMIGVQQIDRIVEVVEDTLNGNVVQFLEQRVDQSSSNRRRLGGAPLDLPKVRRNPLVEILAISTGCLNACTYCKTKHARGVLASYSVLELLHRARSAFEEGVKELWLTSEDLGAYGHDLERNPFDPAEMAAARWYQQNQVTDRSLDQKFPSHLTLADLLARLVPLIPEGCMLRLGMTNPPYILAQLQEVLFVLQHPRVYSFIHIPVQSGSNAVLADMQREYTREEFERIMTQLRATFDGLEHRVTVATDIICGFPTETEQHFQETVSLVKSHQFPTLFINQFFPRPGTPAANMARVATPREVKRRTAALHELFRAYRPYEQLKGRGASVLITEASSDGKYWVGHTKAYEQVLVEKKPEYLGRMVRVKIQETDKFYMRGTVTDAGPLRHLLTSDDLFASSMPKAPIRERHFELFSKMIPMLTLAVLASWVYLRIVSKA